jgi:SagB-type dehydrogenase family enzyme
MSVEEAVSLRRSVRSYAKRDLTTEEISQLLWSCQGITDEGRSLRAAPSAGALFPLEVYLLTGDGLYHYLPHSHSLEVLQKKNLKADLAKACWGQPFVEAAAVDIVICAVYERITGRYGERGVRYTDIEVGHAAENVALQAVALGLDSVPVGAFNDDEVSKVLGLPREARPIYILPVGHKK